MTDPIALSVKRLPKQTLHHVWAPKLNRTVALAGRDQLHLWVMLEAHPEISRYCERPTWPDENEASPEPDFWALRDGSAVWLALGDAPQCDPNAAPLPAAMPCVQWVHADAPRYSNGGGLGCELARALAGIGTAHRFHSAGARLDQLVDQSTGSQASHLNQDLARTGRAVAGRGPGEFPVYVGRSH